METEPTNGLERLLRRRDNVVAREVAGERLLIPVRGRLADMQRIFALDPVAGHIWAHLDGSRSLAGILASVLDSFDVDELTARPDIFEFVGALEAAGLVESVGGGDGSPGGRERQP